MAIGFVPFDEIIALLNASGRTNVASIRGDLARYP